MSDVNPVTDVKPSDNYAEDIYFAYNHGLMNGVGNKKFDPDSQFTRAMVVTVLYNLEGKPKSNAKLPFTDVKEKDWFSSAVKWAYENKVVDGVSASEFAPNRAITKEEFCALLLKYSKYKAYDTESKEKLVGFDDAAAVSSWAKDYVNWAFAKGIISADDGTKLDSGSFASRALSAAYFRRFFENTVR